MIVTDITDEYVKKILHEDDLKAYEKTFPDLFDQYFTYWASRRNWHQELGEAAIKERKELVLSRLPIIGSNLSRAGFDTEHIRTVLMVGQGTTNGHAFRHQDEFSVFLPLEGYSTTEQVDIFVTHEIVHALHYAAQPDFFYETPEEKDSVARQILTEGIATYLTKTVMNVSDGAALWADYLSEDKLENWMKSCISEKQRLFEEVREIIKNNKTAVGLFATEDVKDIRTYRAGYFVGLELVKGISMKHGFSAPDLLRIDRKRLEQMVIDFLS